MTSRPPVRPDARVWPDERALRESAASIAAAQEPSGAIPWEPGGHTDVWDHVECAMALLVAGQQDAAHAAYAWMRATQRPDGTWPIKQTRGVVEDAGADTNQCAYLAVGVWHHWLVMRDRRFVEAMWPSVRAALNFVAAQALPWGGVRWAVGEWGTPCAEALLAGGASIHYSLGCGMLLADLLGEDASAWAQVREGLGEAVRSREGEFADNRRFSMDWYYPVLGGAVRGEAARERVAARWDEFVVPGWGIRCVADRPWATGAETCELALALEALGDKAAARELVLDVQHLRDDDGAYWTGYVWPDEARWPIERSTWTAAAVILAVDAVDERSPGSPIFATTVPSP